MHCRVFGGGRPSINAGFAIQRRGVARAADASEDHDALDAKAVVDDDGGPAQASARLYSALQARREAPRMSPRFAIYVSPPPDSASWRAGARVLDLRL